MENKELKGQFGRREVPFRQLLEALTEQDGENLLHICRLLQEELKDEGIL